MIRGETGAIFVGPDQEPAQHHAGVIVQVSSPTAAGEELLGVAIVLRCCARHHLFERNGELIWVK